MDRGRGGDYAALTAALLSTCCSRSYYLLRRHERARRVGTLHLPCCRSWLPGRPGARHLRRCTDKVFAVPACRRRTSLLTLRLAGILLLRASRTPPPVALVKDTWMDSTWALGGPYCTCAAALAAFSIRFFNLCFTLPGVNTWRGRTPHNACHAPPERYYHTALTPCACGVSRSGGSGFRTGYMQRGHFLRLSWTTTGG